MPNSRSEVLQATSEAENSLIGSILIESTRGNRDAINQVSQICSVDNFQSERNKRIYNAMLSCQKPPDQINVALELEQKGELQTNDCSHMSLAISKTPNSLDYINYARAVVAYSESRQGKGKVKVRGIQL